MSIVGLALLGGGAALVEPGRLANAPCFTVLYATVDATLWFKIARQYRYPFFGRQLIGVLISSLFFFALVLLLGTAAKGLRRWVLHLGSKSHAT